MFKRIYIFLSLIFSFILFENIVYADNLIANKPTNSTVYDPHHYLSENTITKINELNKQSENSENKVQVAVYIVSSLNGASLEETTLNIARKWKIGFSDSNQGALLFLAINDRKMRIETSDNLATILTDNKSRIVLNSMKDSLRSKNYDEAVLSAVNNILDIKDGKILKDNDNDFNIENIIVSLIIIFIIFLALKNTFFPYAPIFTPSEPRRYKDDDDNNWFGGSSSDGGSNWSGGGFSGGGSSSDW